MRWATAAGAVLLAIFLGTATATASPYVSQVRDVNFGLEDSHPQELAAVGATLFFAADDGVHGIELWKSDGTTAGTSLVADLNPGGVSSSPAELTAVGGNLFFTATSNGGADRDVYVSDGTTAGTDPVASFPSADPPGNLAVFGDEL